MVELVKNVRVAQTSAMIRQCEKLFHLMLSPLIVGTALAQFSRGAPGVTWSHISMIQEYENHVLLLDVKRKSQVGIKRSFLAYYEKQSY